MISASMHCFRSVATALLLALASVAASAHKASDAYLRLDATAQATTVRVDVALRDLDIALDIDADGDARLTAGEVRAAWPRIESYLLARVQVAGCELHPVAQSLERRVDGVYAALSLASDCRLAAAPAIRYAVLGEVDVTHRGLADIEVAGQPRVLRVLDPARPEPVDSAAVSSGQFLGEGIHHILSGYDHVLFLVCLLLPSVMRRTPQGWQPVPRLAHALWPVFGIVTAFTVAHSITLALAALKWVALSPAFIEPAIAVTIMLAALDNVWPIFRGRRAVVTFCFGLIHGFGFAGVLAELNLPGSQFAWALLQFNLGLELGQMMIVAAVTALLYALRERPRYPQWAIRGGSLAAMGVGLLWFIERTANVSLLPL